MVKRLPIWRYVPIDYNHVLGELENVTQKSVFVNNLRGEAVQIRFHNRYGRQVMVIENASIAVRNRVTGRCCAWADVTLNGSRTISIAPGDAPWSDPIKLPVTEQDDILLNLYFKEKTQLYSVCTTATGLGWQTSHHTGNYREGENLGFTVKQQIAPTIAAEPYPLQFAAGICEIAVWTQSAAKVICLFGDSVTHMSYFHDRLLELLYAHYPSAVSLVNAGISGNRLQKPWPQSPLFAGGGHQFGMAGRDRFLQDVYDTDKPDLVLILEGVNDCSHSILFNEPDIPTAQDIYAALCEVCDIAKTNGSKTIVSTVPPFGAFGEPWRDAAEAIRCEYNALIRGGGTGDGVVDFDAALRDPLDIHRMQAGMDLGDGVHPNWAGGAKMAQTALNILKQF